MTMFLTVLAVYVIIGLVAGNAMAWYAITRDHKPTAVQLIVYYAAYLILGQLWLPASIYVMYNSKGNHYE